MTIPTSKLRVARPTDDIKALLPFYRDGLGLQVLGEFEDHEGFDGLMLGVPQGTNHFEFTHHRGHGAGRAPTQDNLVVFYIQDHAVWQAAVERMPQPGFEAVPSRNPYWDREGLTFEDPDGYRVVLQHGAWKDGL